MFFNGERKREDWPVFTAARGFWRWHEKYLGGQDLALRWLKRPNRALGGQRPLDLMDTTESEGAFSVESCVRMHLSLAMVEYFVHLDLDDPPRDLVVVSGDISDSVTRNKYTRLPKNWRENPPPPELAEVGDTFVREGKAAVLIIPSAIAPSEANWLINPLHAEFAKIRISRPEPFEYDARFFRRPN